MRPELDTVERPHRPRAARRRRTRRVGAAAMALCAALALSGCWSANQTKVVDQINATRSSERKGAVSGNKQAMDKAQAWSAHMARTGRLEHTGGGSRIDPSGLPRWCAMAENVGMGSSTEAVHRTFLASPTHRANILGNFDRVGTGVVRNGSTVWVTQIFYRAC